MFDDDEMMDTTEPQEMQATELPDMLMTSSPPPTIKTSACALRELDHWIETLYARQPLSEDQVRVMCQKVGQLLQEFQQYPLF